MEHEPRVNEITSESTIVLRFEFIVKNCGKLVITRGLHGFDCFHN